MKIKSTQPKPEGLVPTGLLKALRPEEVHPSATNPRLLFDPEPLDILKENIRQHGVLVPITVYQKRGQSKYHILDGERRHRCCIELQNEGIEITIPANVVEPPTRVAGMLYMFAIHNVRHPWELMPVALSLQTVMIELGEKDTERLAKLTALSAPQVERCKTLLEFPEKYQQMSLRQDPKERIPANFWIELFPLFEIVKTATPTDYKKLGRDGICDQMVAKYWNGSIKSVIHFRRISEAFELTRESRAEDFSNALHEYLNNIDLETRKAFDQFTVDGKKLLGAIAACDDFLKDLKKNKIEHIVDGKDKVMDRLKDVRRYIDQLITKLEGSDAPKE